MKFGLRIPRISREEFQALEQATRPGGKLSKFVELVGAGRFDVHYAEQVDLKIVTRPGYPLGTREIVSLEQLGELFKMLECFPSTMSFPDERIAEVTRQLTTLLGLRVIRLRGLTAASDPVATGELSMMDQELRELRKQILFLVGHEEV